MQTGAAIGRMQAFHAQLRELLKESVEIVERAEADTVALAVLRWRVVRTLREYQLFKHTEVFDPLIRSAIPPRSVSAVEMKKRCEELGAAYNDHIRRWNLGGTGPASPEYVADARRVIRLVIDHLSREDLGIRRLLTGLDRIRGGNAPL